MRHDRKAFIARRVFAAVLLSFACCANRCRPEPGELGALWTVSATDRTFFLGRSRNNFDIRHDFYAGPNVTHVRFKLKFVQLGAPISWITGVAIVLSTESGGVFVERQRITQLPTDAVGGEFWTNEMIGNFVRIQVTSLGQFVPVGAASAVQISKVGYQYGSAVAVDAVPTASTVYVDYGNTRHGYALLQPNREVYSQSIGLSPATHYYRFDVPAGTTDRYFVYVSPLNFKLGNDVGLVLGLSDSSFVKPSIGTAPTPGKIIPAVGDTGIYEAFGPYPDGKTVFLAVRSSVGASYSISVSQPQRLFNIDIEMEDSFSGGRTTATSLDGMVTMWFQPHSQQLRRYLPTSRTYPIRMEEVVAMASANMLASTQGLMRFDAADIYLSTHWWRNVDLVVKQGSGRAETGVFSITMYQNDLNEPISGARTLLHEWGHFEFGLDDEYLDISPVDLSTSIDPNSLMGLDNDSFIRFCDINHQWADGIADWQSNWYALRDKYNLWNYWASEGREWLPADQESLFQDVLHKIESLMTFRFYE